MLLEELRRADPRLVGLVETGGDEERLVPVAGHQLDDARRRGSVRRHARRLTGRAPRQGQTRRPPESSEDVGAGHAVLGTVDPGVVPLPGQVDAGQVARQMKAHLRLSREGEVRHVPGNHVLEDVVRDLSHPRREVAVIVEVLGQHPQVVSDRAAGRRLAVVDARRGWPQSAQERRPRRVAERVLHVGAVEANALRGEAIQVRGLRSRVLRGRRRVEVGTERDVQVVGDDEQDVGAFFQAGFPIRRRGRQQQLVGPVAGLRGAGHGEQRAEQQEYGLLSHGMRPASQ